MTSECVWPDCGNKPWLTLPICATHREEVVRVAREHSRSRRTAGNGRKAVVYYLRVGDLVKVGYSFTLEQRLRQYPPDTEVLAIEPGDEVLEKRRHHDLRNSRARGREWYHPTEEVELHIARIVEQHGPPVVIKERSSRRRSGPKVHYPVTVRHADPPARRDT